jgi:SAM-dependent methyltransferase
MTAAATLSELAGGMDIYLLDQILRGRFESRHRVLDVGCGAGRNLLWFLEGERDVYGLDRRPDLLAQARTLARRRGRPSGPDRFTAAAAEAIPFADGAFDAVLSIAVLHFARGPEHFRCMLDEAWRVLAPGGLFFSRLASSIGLEDRVQPRGAGRFRIPDGSERFLVDEAALLEHAARLGATLADPIKTTNVQNLRCMTTWVLEKAAP